MKFQRYGIEMERLEVKHLEMMRQWRNSELVRSRMHFRDFIDEASQRSWFESINNTGNWYFIAYLKDVAFGVFHIKNINWEIKTGEAGAFVGDAKFIGDVTAALAILALMDFGFFELDLETLEAKYHPGFKEVNALNDQLGYEKISDESDGFVRAKVSKARYVEKTERLRKAHNSTTHTS